MTTKYEQLKEYTLDKYNRKAALSQGEVRENAIENFKQTAYPGRKDESWKYTNLSALLSNRFEPVSQVKLSKEIVEKNMIQGLDADMLVFVNGYFSEEYSTVKYDKVVISSMSEARKNHADVFTKYFNQAGLKPDSVFTAQNTAFANEGTFIYLKKNKSLTSPIHILHIADNNGVAAVMQIRNLIVAEENSQARIVETQCSVSENNDTPTFNNTVTEIFLLPNSYLDYNRLQNESNSTSQINNLRVKQSAHTSFTCNTITLSGKLVRNEIYVDLIGEGAETNLKGLYLPVGNQHFDNLTYIYHGVPNGQSNQTYKGILDNNSTAAFNGMVYVAKDAQKTDAYQSNKNILLSDEAKVHSRPQLEIYADDVKCSHGSTTGQLDRDALFYLRARGIDKDKARALLLYAFASEVVNKIKLKPFRELLEKRLSEHFLD